MEKKSWQKKTLQKKHFEPHTNPQKTFACFFLIMTEIEEGHLLVNMLDMIVHGNHKFEGEHALDKVSPTTYTSYFYNYFIKTTPGNVFLALHPHMEHHICEDKMHLKPYIWYGYNTDPVEPITAAMAAKLFQKK